MPNHTGASPTESCLRPFILAIYHDWEFWTIGCQAIGGRITEYGRFGAPLHASSLESNDYQIWARVSANILPISFLSNKL
jgi:hypothetical protein